MLLFGEEKILCIYFLSRLCIFCSWPDAIPHNVGMLLIVSLVEYIVQCCVICLISRILGLVRSTPWYGSALVISCIVVYYFAFGEVAQFGLSYLVDII
jgi:hypothetical protein